MVLDGDCGQQEMGSRFLKQIGGSFANEIAVVTPNGQALSSEPDEGLQRWRTLPPAVRRRLDDLGCYDSSLVPTPPAGGLILRVFARGLNRDPAGRWQIYRNPLAPLSQEAGRDFLWLTREEWQSLLPCTELPGESYPVSAPLSDRFCRRYLIDLVRIGGEGHPRRPEDVLSEKLQLTVEKYTPDQWLLRLDGAATFVTRGPEFGVPAGQSRTDTFRVLGFLEYDPIAKAFRRFDVAAIGPTGHFDEIGRRLMALGVAFELTEGKRPADRVRPSSFDGSYFRDGR